MRKNNHPNPDGPGFSLLFFVVLAVLAVIAAILPLRPTVSYAEKRELTKFPEFSLEALVSGAYFEDISLWYSDTFPGREGWLELSQGISALHGYGSIAIEGDLPEMEEIPDIPAPTKPASLPTEEETLPGETVPEESEEPEQTASSQETTEPSDTDDGEILLDATFSSTSIIQIGDSAYHPLGFSQKNSDRYVRIVSAFADAMAPQGVRVVSAPPPQAIGTMVDAQYLPELRSSDQDKMLSYMHESMSENVVTVDTHNALIPHRAEYLFFHSDHHWTALAAYYCYRATCEAMGLEPAELDTFEVMDQGEFRGTIHGRARYPYKLAKDTVYAYVPPGDITLTVFGKNGGSREGSVIRDLSKANLNSKYLCFLEGDQALVQMVNHDLPEDAGSCLIVKDSFGNCFVPYFSQNYRNVFAIDYRKYTRGGMKYLINKYGIQDVIIAPNMMSTQSDLGMDALGGQCGYRY